MIQEYPAIFKHYKILEELQSEKNPEKIKQLCLQDIELMPDFCMQIKQRADESVAKSMQLAHLCGENHPLEYYKKQRASMYLIPNVYTYKILAVLYEKEGNISEAINICKQAIQDGFEKDGTTGGMEKRLKKLMKKL